MGRDGRRKAISPLSSANRFFSPFRAEGTRAEGSGELELRNKLVLGRFDLNLESNPIDPLFAPLSGLYGKIALKSAWDAPDEFKASISDITPRIFTRVHFLAARRLCTRISSILSARS